VAGSGDWDTAEPLLHVGVPQNLSAWQSYWDAMSANSSKYNAVIRRFEAFLWASGFTNPQVVALMTYH
jgi:hypothetical protein